MFMGGELGVVGLMGESPDGYARRGYKGTDYSFHVYEAQSLANVVADYDYVWV